MGIRTMGIGIVVSLAVSFTTVIFLVLFWGQLNLWVEGMNVGFLMFFNMNFWTFLVFFMGLSFALTLIMRFAIKAKFGGSS